MYEVKKNNLWLKKLLNLTFSQFFQPFKTYKKIFYKEFLQNFKFYI